MPDDADRFQGETGGADGGTIHDRESAGPGAAAAPPAAESPVARMARAAVRRGAARLPRRVAGALPHGGGCRGDGGGAGRGRARRVEGEVDLAALEGPPAPPPSPPPANDAGGGAP